MSILKRCPDILTLSRTLLSNSRTPKTGKIIRLSNKVLVDQHVKCSKVSEAAEVRYRYVCEDHECTLLESVCLCLMSSPAKLRDWPIHHHREAKSKSEPKEPERSEVWQVKKVIKVKGVGLGPEVENTIGESESESVTTTPTNWCEFGFGSPRPFYQCNAIHMMAARCWLHRTNCVTKLQSPGKFSAAASNAMPSTWWQCAAGCIA